VAGWVSHLEEIGDRGFTVLDRNIPAHLVRRLQDTIDRLDDEQDRLLGVDHLDAIDQRGALHNLCDFDSAFVDLLRAFPIRELAPVSIGPNYILHTYDSLSMYPGQNRYPWDFHTDLMPFNDVDVPKGSALGLTFLCYLDRTTTTTGATFLVPYSHRRRGHLPDLEDLSASAMQMEVMPGTVVVMDARLWHCSSWNAGHRKRRLVKACVTRSAIQPVFDYVRSTRPESLASLPAEVRELFGTPPMVSISEFHDRLPPSQPLERRRL
jgi:hypothetical protein